MDKPFVSPYRESLHGFRRLVSKFEFSVLTRPAVVSPRSSLLITSIIRYRALYTDTFVFVYVHCTRAYNNGVRARIASLSPRSALAVMVTVVVAIEFYDHRPSVYDDRPS